ncbi:oligosaccharide flippase family protein [Coraliomargarita algicola]|uniref:Oligosaccharide flippase family protein n=1 Tax=Coraliomargarita algicola TaxID=3092156 RepID=A0ABZ0RNX3_9BACT|nr:oligosaccharide flippase family protein [Coraliomargarita sp. J2-16]WPJ96823.1 oligosaccharide flippase family protein [Coraliomargarita sp. J2-16]
MSVINPVETPIWKRYFWRNTASNYVRTITRLLLGVVLFRLLFSGLTAAEFGFWSLLWSLFGYGILLDFGFGFTAQKAVAEKSATGEWDELSRLLSTMLWTFVGLAVLLGLFFFAIRGPFLEAIEVPDSDYGMYSLSYLIFFAGLALTFPFGLFPEVLRGLQRIDIANWLNTGSVVLNFIGIVVALYFEASFPVIILVSVFTTLLPNMGALVMAMRRLPQVSLSPRLFQWRVVKSQLGFSIAAYLITFSNLLMAKSDQAVLGFTMGVGVIAAYQAGYKVAEMLNMFTRQLQDALSPAAAHLNASGDSAGLRELLLKTSKLTFLITTPLYGLCAVYLEPLIQLLTGMESIESDTILVGQILLFAVFSSQLTNSCTKRILMMCGYEKKLLGLSLLDGISNLGISVVLAFSFGIVGVAIGTLIPTILVGWLLVLPMALRYLNLGMINYSKYILGGAAPLLLFAPCLWATVYFLPMPAAGGFVPLAIRGALSATPAFIWIAFKVRKLM